MLLDLYPYRASAQSGVMRLQLYKMQEEHLLKREALRAAEEALKLQQPVKEESNEQVERQAAPQRARKAAPRKPTVVEREEFPEVRFKRKPIHAGAKPVDENFPLWVHLLSVQIDQWYTQFIPLLEMNRKVIIETTRAAENDADFRLRILLLAA